MVDIILLGLASATRFGPIAWTSVKSSRDTDQRIALESQSSAEASSAGALQQQLNQSDVRNPPLLLLVFKLCHHSVNTSVAI